LLSGGDVEKLLAARTRYGLQTAATFRPDCPVTADAGDTDRVTISRRELETLVEEAVRQDRAQR
jgi:hypothetical protein